MHNCIGVDVFFFGLGVEIFVFWCILRGTGACSVDGSIMVFGVGVCRLWGGAFGGSQRGWSV